MKIATWNVNSLKVRLPHLLDWLAKQSPDVVGLQELKLENAKFPVADLQQAGYHAVFHGQKTYNGVAILSRRPPTDVSTGMPGFDDPQSRVIAATIATASAEVRCICAYVPNGQAVGSDKYRYKLDWLDAFIGFVRDETERFPRLAVLGDYNIAPADEDVHDPAAWEGQVLCSAAERDAFRRLTELGLKDSFRMFSQPEKAFTWWDYRMNAFRRKMGMRIDHVLLSSALAGSCSAVTIDLEPRMLERPSDHAPVVAHFSAIGAAGDAPRQSNEDDSAHVST
ncbi:MAG: exodeoxyribonuclease III [Betaproteobacteria bacterium]|nr:exodeoxyribonuclease III [Betaproteobacteria bacterium]